MNWDQATFPSSQRRGGCAANQMPRSHLFPRRRGGQFGKMLSLEMFCRSDHPVRSIKGGFAIIFNVAATPPLRGGELCLSQFIHTLYDRAFLILRNARS